MKVEFDEDGFRDRIQQERKRLERLLDHSRELGYDDEAAVTNGRVSGMYLALSFLEEFIVRP